VETSFQVVSDALRTFYDRTLTGWNQSEVMANRAVSAMLLSLPSIRDMPEGSVVELSPDGTITLSSEV
jgi:hypothetical protein